MRLVVNAPSAQRVLVRNFEAEALAAQSTAFLELGRDEIGVGSVDRGFENVRFALVRFSPGESGSVAECLQIGSQQQFLLPMLWRDLLLRAHAEDRQTISRAENDCVRFGEMSVDFTTQEAKGADFPVKLTSMEFKTLKYFVLNPHRVISRDELLDKVWGYSSYPCTRTVDNRILRLRQKLEKDPENPRHFLTVHGSGYKFVP